jgi:diguanylate cyclase (GGDEF)-like protein
LGIVAAATIVVVALLDTTGLLGDDGSQLLDDAAQLVAGLFAAVACGMTWRRAVARGGSRQTWLWRALLFLGMTGWTCGQLIWSWYQVVEHRPLPSPSLADDGYFALPLFAFPAVLMLPAGPAPRVLPSELTAAFPREDRRSRPLLTLDATVIVGSLLLLTWSTTLGAAVRSGAATTGEFLIAVGYPVTDLLLVVIVLLTAVFRRPHRPLALVLLGAGLVALSVSDSCFLYLVSAGASGMPPLYNIGFQAGPALIGLAALAPEPGPRAAPASPAADARSATWFTLVPYLPLGMIGLLVLVQQFLRQRPGEVETYGLVALVGTVVLRQLLTNLENLDLLRQVQRSQDLLRHQAFHDVLTGLPNRALFQQRLEQAVHRQRSQGCPLALLFFDLDDFKHVNDTRGHAAGDELLRTAAARLTARAGAGDTVARLGGDEFAVILTGDGDPSVVAGDLLDALDEPVTLARRPHVPQASAGLVVVPPRERHVTASQLLHRADAAMYAAKRGGKGHLVRYRPGLETDQPVSVVEVALSRALEELLGPVGRTPDVVRPDVVSPDVVSPDVVSPDAVSPDAGRARLSGNTPGPGVGNGIGNGIGSGPWTAGNAVSLRYQPIVRLDDGALVAVEALLRWDHPRSGQVAPEVLLGVAEGRGLASALEDLILDLACRDIALIRAGRHGQVPVHVNVGAPRVGEAVLVERVRAALIRHRLPGQALVLEVTEGGRIEDLAAAAAVLQEVRGLGVRVALDDFGSGNSNLGYLLRLPVDLLKLDRSLTAAGRDPGTGQVVSAGAVDLGRRLGIPLIAEGVEDADQAAHLAALGCEYGQGYLFARPLPAIEVTALPTVGVRSG